MLIRAAFLRNIELMLKQELTVAQIAQIHTGERPDVNGPTVNPSLWKRLLLLKSSKLECLSLCPMNPDVHPMRECRRTDGY